MLEHIIERAREEVSSFILAIRHLGHMIESYFGDGSRWGVRIEYLREDAPLGTAGALSLLDPRPTMPFIVTNGDVLTDIRYGELLDFHQRNAAAATMAVRLYEWQHRSAWCIRAAGNHRAGRKTGTSLACQCRRFTPCHRMFFPPCVGPEHCDMPTLFENLRLAGRRTVVYPMHEPWLDVGRPADYDAAERTISGNQTQE